MSRLLCTPSLPRRPLRQPPQAPLRAMCGPFSHPSLLPLSGVAVLAVLLGAGLACRPNQASSPQQICDQGTCQSGNNDEILQKIKSSGGTLSQFHLDGKQSGKKISLLGTKSPTSISKKDPLEITLWWLVSGDALDTAQKNMPRVFVHGQAPLAELNQFQADHILSNSKVTAGTVVVDHIKINIPEQYPADQLEIYVGIYQDKDRWTVQESNGQDGKNRILLPLIQVTDGPPTIPAANIYKTTSAIQIDGVLDEPAWQQAIELGPFVAYDGRSAIKNPTHAKLTWDDQALYVAFIGADQDIHTPYTKRDDPLYDSEAVEIFIDADGDQDEYIELQAAPNDLHFDAAFKGGRRKNFNTAYNLDYESKTILKGTLNNNSDTDEGFISEWRIPYTGMIDVIPPKVGDRWKINLFRLNRIRQGTKVVGNEASAWSSPLSGDFHHLARFGTVVFQNAGTQP